LSLDVHRQGSRGDRGSSTRLQGCRSLILALSQSRGAPRVPVHHYLETQKIQVTIPLSSRNSTTHSYIRCILCKRDHIQNPPPVLIPARQRPSPATKASTHTEPTDGNHGRGTARTLANITPPLGARFKHGDAIRSVAGAVREG
jgi:hypothetical protein